MIIQQYEVTVEFELAVIAGHERSERLSLELNQLFNDMVRAWAKDKSAMVTTTKTTLAGWEEPE